MTPLTRRALLGAAAFSPLLGRAQVGPIRPGPWDESKPVYLEGEVTVIIWSEPQPHLEIIHDGLGGLPPDLARRPVPKQKDPIDIASILSRAVLPVHRGLWYVALPTLARLSAWDVPRPRIKQVIGLVGFPGPPVTGTPAVLAEVIFIGGRAYPMRSDPA